MREFIIADEADQQFDTIINGQRVSIRLRYNHTSGRWTFDLSISSTPVLHGRRIVTGRDLLAAFDFGLGAIFCLPTGETGEPDRDSLPNGRVKLYHATEAEINAAIYPQS